MFKNYWIDTQKGKVLKIMIMLWRPCEDFECEKYKDIFVWNNAWPRLSQLLKDWVLEVTYYKNPLKGWKRAIYSLKKEAQEYYARLYNIERGFFAKIIASLS